jgi:hypothetical protein
MYEPCIVWLDCEGLHEALLSAFMETSSPVYRTFQFTLNWSVHAKLC